MAARKQANSESTKEPGRTITFFVLNSKVPTCWCRMRFHIVNLKIITTIRFLCSMETATHIISSFNFKFISQFRLKTTPCINVPIKTTDIWSHLGLGMFKNKNTACTWITFIISIFFILNFVSTSKASCLSKCSSSLNSFLTELFKFPLQF